MTRGEDDCPVTRRAVARPLHAAGWLLALLAILCGAAAILVPFTSMVTAQQAADSPLAAPTAIVAITPAISATATVSAGIAELAQATFTPLPVATAPPPVLITELMIAPRAAGEEAGEWLELTNQGTASINLRDWTIVHPPEQAHIVDADVWIDPGAYVVLARNGDAARNGGVTVAYVYVDLELPNDAGELVLQAPNNLEVDRVAWVAQQVVSGHSLERTAYDAGAAWTPAWAVWPGSADDFGSPGAAYSPAPTPTATPTLAPAVTQTPMIAPSATSTATPLPTPHPSRVPALRLSEVMVNPAAVSDEAGEWIELANIGADAINLQGWTLSDLDRDAYVIPAEVWVAPGAYVVLARDGDAAANGGVAAQLVFDGLQLANERDELILAAPWGAEADRLVWGEAGVSAPEGVSLERTAFDASGGWAVAATIWLGSAGDRGSPGTAYSAPPATATPTTAATALPTATPTATATLPGAWRTAAQPGPLVIDEVQPWGEDTEFIALHNVGDVALDLTGWSVGDAEMPGDGEGMDWLPEGLQLAPGALAVIARNGAAFQGAWGRAPDAEIEETDPVIPNLALRRDLASGALALNDGGDELLLLNPAGEVADAVAYGEGDMALLGLEGLLQPQRGLSIQRAPGYRFPATREVRMRFLTGLPDPFAAASLPQAVRQAPPVLDGGMVALWGTLGAVSNFSAQGSAPPHYVLAAAGSAGLDFAAIADAGIVHAMDAEWQGQSFPISLPAWRWRNVDGAAAIVYGAPVVPVATWAELDQYLAANGAFAQAEVDDPPLLPRLAAVRADAITAPYGLAKLQTCWAVSHQPWLPAGNATPPLPGTLSGPVRITGVAAASADLPGILAALAARRGWLASAPGLWLTLRTASGAWMGETVAPADAATLQIDYGDLSGQPAGLSLWVDKRLMQQLDLPPRDGHWTVSVPAVPGSLLYVVATQADGDFAVTAPLRVAYTDGELEIPNETPVDETQEPQPGRTAEDDEDAAPVSALAATGQASGPPGSLALAKLSGLARPVEFRAQVVAPPGLFNAAIYVAEPAPLADGTPTDTVGLGIQVYLKQGEFAPMQEGDWVLVRGDMHSFRGEMEVIAQAPEQVWRYAEGAPLLPLLVEVAEIGEALEGRLVTVRGVVVGWQGESILLADPAQPEAEPVRVTVRSSLGWRRPYVMKGEVWQATGIISQFARKAPWNGGYRVLVRFQADLVKIGMP